MAILPLSAAQRSSLRADAHVLSPVVMIGDAGLSEAVIKETDAALAAHTLIKVRVFADEKDVRAEYFDALCDRLGAAQVQHIGTTLVLYRPASLTPKKKTFAQTLAGDDDSFKGNAPRRVTIMKAGAPNRKPKAQRVTIKGNERLTQSGTVKRAKKTTISGKKKMG